MTISDRENEVFDDETDEIDDTRPTAIELPDTRTESEKFNDQQLDRIDRFFSQLQPGATLLIERHQPSWCSGILEEIVVTDDALSLDYFIDTWGGTVLGVKLRGARGRFNGGSYKIPLNSYPPKVYGEIITKSDIMDRMRGSEKQENQQPGLVVNNPPPRSSSIDKFFAALPALLPPFLKYVESAAVRRQQEMMMMMKMMTNGSGGNSNNIADITRMGNALADLQRTFGAAAAPQGELTDFIPQALDILQSLVRKGPEQGAVQQPGRLTAATIPPPPKNVRPIRGSIASSISEMAPTAAAQTILEALDSMSPDRRSEAINAFMREFPQKMGGLSDDFDDEGTND
jgi:hypothetical protein